ncbi:hypothetical protein CTAYLR_008232 [Chrysophaeum taylorii]|uniref:RRM domain-containing protein n=1 Tax=Chrysophaeum taylorii TaxID=2483200 RepID=A0AAD7UKF1_9STRA|nr:hypothetical protein CTAYLR_008232 [Chrysophaeum taylorii]
MMVGAPLPDFLRRDFPDDEPLLEATRGLVFLQFSDVRHAAIARRQIPDDLRRAIPQTGDVAARSIAHVPVPTKDTDPRDWLLLESRTIVISGMPANSAEPDLRAVFHQNHYGDIEDVRKATLAGSVLFTVTFYNRTDAERAVSELAPGADDSGLGVAIQSPSDAEIATLRALGSLLDNWRKEERLFTSPRPSGAGASFVSMVSSFATARQSQSSLVGSDSSSSRDSFNNNDQLSVRSSLPEHHFAAAAARTAIPQDRATFDALFLQQQQQQQQQQHVGRRSFAAPVSRRADELRTIDECANRHHYENPYYSFHLDDSEDGGRRKDRATFSDADHLVTIAASAPAAAPFHLNRDIFDPVARTSSFPSFVPASDSADGGLHHRHHIASPDLSSIRGAFVEPLQHQHPGRQSFAAAEPSTFAPEQQQHHHQHQPPIALYMPPDHFDARDDTTWAPMAANSHGGGPLLARRDDSASFDDFLLAQRHLTTQTARNNGPPILGPIPDAAQLRQSDHALLHQRRAPNPQQQQQQTSSPTSRRANRRRDGASTTRPTGGGGGGGGGGFGAASPSTYSPAAAANNSNPADFAFDFDRAVNGSDQRTTLMVRNIPNKYTQQAVLDEINVKFKKCYDFFYLPIDFKNKCNVGYAFINLIDYRDAPAFYQEFHGRRWSCFRSGKVCAITYARIQGRQSMITRFQNSSLLNESIEVQPRLFRSSGPLKGEPEPFPGTAAVPEHTHHQPQLAAAAIPAAVNPTATDRPTLTINLVAAARGATARKPMAPRSFSL